eukprot:scaffold56601_cov81-Phaeocystis_antarctica.AAC.1
MSLLRRRVPGRRYRYIGASRTSGTPNMLPEGHCTRLNQPHGHTAAHARTEHNSSREQALLSQQLGPTHERAQVHHIPCVLQAGAKGFVT